MNDSEHGTPVTPTAPAEVYRHGLQLLLDKDIDGWVALCDEHAVFEFPFAPDGYPKRLAGLPAVAAYMRTIPITSTSMPSPIWRSTGPTTRTPSSSKCAPSAGSWRPAPRTRCRTSPW